MIERVAYPLGCSLAKLVYSLAADFVAVVTLAPRPATQVATNDDRAVAVAEHSQRPADLLPRTIEKLVSLLVALGCRRIEGQVAGVDRANFRIPLPPDVSQLLFQTAHRIGGEHSTGVVKLCGSPERIGQRRYFIVRQIAAEPIAADGKR